MEGHTVQWARAEPGCYLFTFSGRPHLTTKKTHTQTQIKNKDRKKQNKKRKKELNQNYQHKTWIATFSMKSKDTVAMCFLSAVTALAVIALVWASIKAVLHGAHNCSFKHEQSCAFPLKPPFHLQPFPMSHVSICPSKEVVARWLSLRKTQLEIPSQLLTSDFTFCFKEI